VFVFFGRGLSSIGLGNEGLIDFGGLDAINR